MHIAYREHGAAIRHVAGVVLIVAAVLAVAVHPARARLLRAIGDPVSQQGGAFGGALASVGSDLAVGAPGERVFDRDRAGLVQLFTTGGVLRRTFEAPAPVADAAFGVALAVRDGLLHVGAPGDRPIGLAGLGAIHVFDVATGGLVRTVRPPAAGASGVPVGGPPIPAGLLQSTAALPEALGFGRALTVVGDRLVVGAPESIVEGLAGAGAVYLFDGQGTLLRTFRETSPTAGARFGTSVALIADVLFVGAPGAPVGGVESAGVVWAYDARTGDPLQTLNAPLPVERAAFGTVVGEIAGALFVGAPGDQAVGLDGVGAVYLFPAHRATPVAIIDAPAPAADLAFGHAVAVVGTDLLVGADGAGPDHSGTAYLIDPATSIVRATFAPASLREDGRFGFALATVGTAIAIGEPAPGARASSGQVYLFGSTTGTATGRPVARRIPPPAGLRTPATGAIDPATLATSCAQEPTPASVDCRLSLLLGTVLRVAPRELASPLLRAWRASHRGEGTRGPGRVRALRRAARGVDAFTRLLDTRGAPGVAADLRDALVTLAGSIEGDLVTLVSAPR